MDLWRYIRATLACGLLFLTALSVSCTRSVPERLNLSIVIPNSSSSQSSTLSGTQLKLAILNLRENTSAKPRVFHFERGRDFTGVSSGGSIVLTLTGNQIPISTNLVVQYLGVYESATGAMQFSYGDVVVNSAVSGEIAANITSKMFGGSAKEIRFGGQYLTGDGTGPTGRLITYFQPPDPTKPLVAIKQTTMVNGWFAAFALDAGDGSNPVKLTYKLLDDLTGAEQLIFQEVNSAHPMFSPSNPDIRIFSAPAHFEKETRGNYVEARPVAAIDYIAGYWKSATGLLPVGAGVEYSSAQETIDNVFLNSSLTEPMPYNHPTPGAGLSMSGGGIGPGSPLSNIKFHHQRINSEETHAFGFDGPFGIVDEEEPYNSAFLKATFDGFSSIILTWKYLNGVVGDAIIPQPGDPVDGVTVFHKTQLGGWDNSGDSDSFSVDAPPTCYERLISDGFVPYDEDVEAFSGGGTSAIYYESPLGVPFSPNDYYNNHFALCPYRVVGGTKKYFSRYVRTGCIGDCYSRERQFSFGRKIPGLAGHDISITSNTDFADPNVKGASIRVTSVSNVASDEFYVYYQSGSSFDSYIQPEDEVLLIVLGKKGAGCGSSGSYSFDFAKVVSIVSSGTIHVKGGSNLLSNISNLSGTPTDSDFCYLQMTRVVHAGNFTITGAGQLQVSPINLLGNVGGGVIAIRVNGVLDLSTTNPIAINASGSGYPGDMSSGYGYEGQGGNDAGKATDFASGSGGASVGSGGRGDDGTLNHFGGVGWSYYGWDDPYYMPIEFRAGGGGGGDALAKYGGGGGGIIFVMAREIKLYSSGDTTIQANGMNGDNADMNSDAGGGGGGGSILLLTSKVTKTSTGGLKLVAKGGDGGWSSDIDHVAGGGGGGGLVIARTCDSSLANVNANADGGSAGSGFVFATSGENGAVSLGTSMALACLP